MEWISEPKNVKLDLVDLSVAVLGKLGLKNIIELGKIKLVKVEQKTIDTNEFDELENLIDSQ